MVNIEDNPLYYATIGGIIIGLATSLNYVFRGSVTGMSGMLYSTVTLDKSTFCLISRLNAEEYCNYRWDVDSWGHVFRYILIRNFKQIYPVRTIVINNNKNFAIGICSGWDPGGIRNETVERVHEWSRIMRTGPIQLPFVSCSIDFPPVWVCHSHYHLPRWRPRTFHINKVLTHNGL